MFVPVNPIESVTITGVSCPQVQDTAVISFTTWPSRTSRRHLLLGLLTGTVWLCGLHQQFELDTSIIVVRFELNSDGTITHNGLTNGKLIVTTQDTLEYSRNTEKRNFN